MTPMKNIHRANFYQLNQKNYSYLIFLDFLISLEVKNFICHFASDLKTLNSMDI